MGLAVSQCSLNLVAKALNFCANDMVRWGVERGDDVVAEEVLIQLIPRAGEEITLRLR